MTHANQTLTVDEEVDLYINGKLDEQQEIEFEARYLEDPAILEKVELAQQLKTSLKAVDAADLNVSKPLLPKWVRYYCVPQTAWGALAAILLLAPLIVTTRSVNTPAIDSELVIIGNSVLRSSSANAPETQPVITLDGNKPWLTLAFEVPPSLGRPIAWRLALRDAKGVSVYHGEPQYPNGRSIVSVTLNTRALSQDTYSYRIEPQAGDKNPLTGRLLMQR